MFSKVRSATFVTAYDSLPVCGSVRCFDSGTQTIPAIVDALLREKVVILPNYWTARQAKLGRAEVRRAVNDCRQVVNGRDYRRLGHNELLDEYPIAATFANDSFIIAVALAFLNKTNISVKAQAGLTLVGGNSGAGWHKDTVRRGFKALIYLNDVSDAGGPFGFLANYSDAHLRHAFDKRGRNTRYSQQSIDDQVEVFGAQTRRIHAPAGSMVLFDISNVHRGAPCRKRMRSVLTLYVDTPLKSAFCAPMQHVYQELDT